ncbi:MAG: acyltransferase [Pseudomonadota bacterium]
MQAGDQIAAAHQRYLETRFFGSLNGLRFICIMAVIWHHSPALGSLSAPPILALRGFLGVDFFFVLSGFLITTLLLREEARTGRFSIRGFYRRRILRIVPVYFLVVTAAVLWFVVYKGQSEHWPKVPYYYLFFSNMLKGDIALLHPTWSLSVEEQYYLMWPALLLLLPMRGPVRLYVLLGLIAFCVASAAGLLKPLGLRPIETEHAIWKLPATGYAAILLGSLSAVVLNAPRGYLLAYRLVGHPLSPLICFAILTCAIIWLPQDLRGWPNLVVHSLMMLTLVSIVLREDHVLARPFAWGPVARIGVISYGLYLYHMIGRHIGVELVGALNLPAALAPWAQTAVFVAASIVIAEISFRTFEAYFLKLKDSKPAA